MKSIKKRFKRITISGIHTFEKGVIVIIPSIAIAYGKDGVTIGIIFGPWSLAIDIDYKPETSDIDAKH